MQILPLNSHDTIEQSHEERAADCAGIEPVVPDCKKQALAYYQTMAAGLQAEVSASAARRAHAASAGAAAVPA